MKLYKLTLIALFVLILIRGFETAAQDKHWVSYEPALVELEGKLTVALKYGPPNYGERPKTDAKVRVPVLVLIKPVNVRGTPGEAFSAKSVKGVRRIQLIFNTETPYKQLIGRKVLVKGTLFHAFSGHHYTDVVMDVRSVNQLSERRR